jgi:hypothetical protein
MLIGVDTHWGQLHRIAQYLSQPVPAVCNIEISKRHLPYGILEVVHKLVMTESCFKYTDPELVDGVFVEEEDDKEFADADLAPRAPLRSKQSAPLKATPMKKALKSLNKSLETKTQAASRLYEPHAEIGLVKEFFGDRINELIGLASANSNSVDPTLFPKLDALKHI